MKKLFTLIAALFVAFGANASEILTPSFNSWDAAKCTVDGMSISYTEAWAGAGAWLAGGDAEGNYVGKDLSAADYLWVTVAAGATVDVNLVVQYTTKCVAGAAGTSSASIMAGTLVAGAKLDPDQKGDVSQFFLQSTSGAGSITITGIYVGTEAEFEAAKAGDVSEKVKDLALPGDNGVITMPGGENANGWYSPNWIGLTNLDTMFKTLVFEIASAEGPYQLMVQGSEDGSTWNSDGFTTFSEEAHTAPIVITLPVEGKHVNLGQYAFLNMNVSESWMDPETQKQVSMIDDNKVVVTRVYLTSEEVQGTATAISEVNTTSANNAVSYNVAGQRVNANAKGLVIRNGKKFIVK